MSMTHGIEALKDEQKTGRSNKVRDDQCKRLQDDILRDPRKLGYSQNAWDGKLLQTHLELCHGVKLGARVSAAIASN